MKFHLEENGLLITRCLVATYPAAIETIRLYGLADQTRGAMARFLIKAHRDLLSFRWT